MESGTVTVQAMPGVPTVLSPVPTVPLRILDVEPIDAGTFGSIFKGFIDPGRRKIALKKVLQNPNYKNRELDIQKLMDHVNVVALFYYFYVPSETPGSDYLCMVMEFIPSNVSKFMRQHREPVRKPYDLVDVKVGPLPFLIVPCSLICYQMFRGVMYLHAQTIAHRDIKPHNLLWDPEHMVVKVCDFGCAKKILPGETSICYICSRHYRPPELCLGVTQYSLMIDVWSLGCVMAEIYLGQVVFRGNDNHSQLVEIMKILGTPTPAQLNEMNVSPSKALQSFPKKDWKQHLSLGDIPPSDDAVDLMSKTLEMSPGSRLTCAEALLHPYFNDLRLPGRNLRNGRPFPPLFNFNNLGRRESSEDINIEGGIHLSNFQRQKLTWYFEKFFDRNSDGNFMQDDIVNLCEKMREYRGWGEDDRDFLDLMDTHNSFLECLMDQVRMEKAQTTGSKVESVTKREWLNMWGRLISGCTGVADFPYWVQLLPKSLFKVIDKNGDGKITMDELGEFYRNFADIPESELEERTKIGYNSMTANGDYELDYDLYVMNFSNFLLGRTIYGPGKYIFGCFDISDQKNKFKIQYEEPVGA
ncbi:unnamed protein product [Darwinula stevensoni]|uniref:Uncharacterized protein n=1 Tax=Darwinula stevensoni TaxID=69355 RepID=A0A7R8X105_9CRUS|nr:unnamed protein product [Darwinula stevensoni]CAG0881744.1 unnamed protein product [Darwinula stevensoni]